MFVRTGALLACAALSCTGLALAQTSPAPSASPAAAATPLTGPSPAPAITKAITDDYALTCKGTLDPTDDNLTKIFALLAPEYVNVDTKGTQTKRDEVIATAKQQLKTFHGTDCSNNFDAMVAPDANTVIVINNGNVVGDVQAPDGKHDIDVTTKTQDTWKLENGSWLQTESKDLHVTFKVDGNVMQDTGN